MWQGSEYALTTQLTIVTSQKRNNVKKMSKEK